MLPTLGRLPRSRIGTASGAGPPGVVPPAHLPERPAPGVPGPAVSVSSGPRGR
ncbi:hypothetical protein BN2537_5619 [Streptomyces venezuelae]|nr:hypothetical protein BN2537_5619 [Streptomyces venezuelae]